MEQVQNKPSTNAESEVDLDLDQPTVFNEDTREALIAENAIANSSELNALVENLENNTSGKEDPSHGNKLNIDDLLSDGNPSNGNPPSFNGHELIFDLSKPQHGNSNAFP